MKGSVSLIFNPIEAAKAQEDYCNEHELPMFAPANGICYRCCNNIYDPITYRDHDKVYGISVEDAGNQLITSCPHCNYSFVE